MNRLIMMFIGAGTLTSVLSCGPDKNSKEDNTEKILHAAPFAGVTDSIEQSPDNTELLLRRAMLLSQNNLHPLAIPDYKRSWELTGDENIALMYASNLLLSDHIAEAEKLLEEGAEKFPGNTEFNRRLGEIHSQKGEYKKALIQYDNMLAKDSNNFEAWFDKGSMLTKMNDTTGALAALETSFSLLPINYSGIALTNLYIARKDPRALDICDFLISRDSSGTQTEAVYMKGVYYAETKQSDKALQQFDECIKRDWKLTDAYIEKGIILFQKNNIDEAQKVFSLAITVSNTDPDAYYWLGRCFESSGNAGKALENYERAVALDNTFTEAKTAIKRLNG